MVGQSSTIVIVLRKPTANALSPLFRNFVPPQCLRVLHSRIGSGFIKIAVIGVFQNGFYEGIAIGITCRIPVDQSARFRGDRFRKCSSVAGYDRHSSSHRLHRRTTADLREF